MLLILITPEQQRLIIVFILAKWGRAVVVALLCGFTTREDEWVTYGHCYDFLYLCHQSLFTVNYVRGRRWALLERGYYNRRTENDRPGESKRFWDSVALWDLRFSLFVAPRTDSRSSFRELPRRWTDRWFKSSGQTFEWKLWKIQHCRLWQEQVWENQKFCFYRKESRLTCSVSIPFLPARIKEMQLLAKVNSIFWCPRPSEVGIIIGNTNTGVSTRISVKDSFIPGSEFYLSSSAQLRKRSEGSWTSVDYWIQC